MKISKIEKKKIGIFGFGVEGRATLNYFRKHHINNIVVFDEREIDSKVDFEKRIGKFENLKVDDLEVAFRAPGIKRSRLKKILPENVCITSATNLFFAECKGKVLAVTGTKGKSTTVQLLSYMLKAANKEVFSGGNIGAPLLGFVDQTSNDSICVIELSSFQLQDLDGAPDLAVILPIFPDHLDYHEDEQEYLEAKSSIVKLMTKKDVVFCAKQELARKIVAPTRARIFYFAQGDSAEVTAAAKKFKIPEINLAATAAIGEYLKLKVNIEKIAQNFQRLPFRIQFLQRGEGVEFYNDSASTNPISAITAMETMSVPYFLIAGGSSKNLKFDLMAQAAKQDKNLQAVYLIGETAGEIEAELVRADFQKPVYSLGDLDHVLREIKKNLRQVKAVLFSPASASFDQFKNYKDRGKAFNHLVKKLFKS